MFIREELYLKEGEIGVGLFPCKMWPTKSEGNDDVDEGHKEIYKYARKLLVKKGQFHISSEVYVDSTKREIFCIY